MTVITGEIGVPGAKIFYRCVGQGPVLLVAQGGAADADGANALADELADTFSVVSYDRRGLSRSSIESAPVSHSLSVHAQDLLRLADEVSPADKGPVLLVGVSIGALIGLEAAIHAPARFRKIVAFEPPLSQLLPNARKDELVAVQLKLEEDYRDRGALVAMREFAAAIGAVPTQREPGIEVKPSNFARANLEIFLAHDAPAVRTYALEMARVRQISNQLIVGVGHDTANSLHAEMAHILARDIGSPLIEFSGGHGAYATHPRAFAARLRELFNT